MKTIWITALAKDHQRVQRTMDMCRKYGLDANGHFWEDNLKEMKWLGPREPLTHPDTALWLILSDDEMLAAPGVRFGLSMLALSVQGVRGHGLPVMLVHPVDPPAAESLPTPLRNADLLKADNPALGAKIVAKANMPARATTPEYRLDVYALPQLGLWLEAGPTGGEWTGVMAGVCGGEIDAHGVGPAGKLPEKAVLEYPMEGLKLTLGGREYTAWAVHNRLDPGLSYFVRVRGEPDGLILGPLAEGDDAEVFSLDLK